MINIDAKTGVLLDPKPKSTKGGMLLLEEAKKMGIKLDGIVKFKHDTLVLWREHGGNNQNVGLEALVRGMILASTVSSSFKPPAMVLSVYITTPIMLVMMPDIQCYC